MFCIRSVEDCDEAVKLLSSHEDRSLFVMYSRFSRGRPFYRDGYDFIDLFSGYKINFKDDIKHLVSVAWPHYDYIAIVGPFYIVPTEITEEVVSDILSNKIDWSTCNTNY